MQDVDQDLKFKGKLFDQGHSANLPSKRGGLNFSKMAVMGWGGRMGIFNRNWWEARNEGVGFIMGEGPRCVFYATRLERVS